MIYRTLNKFVNAFIKFADSGIDKKDFIFCAYVNLMPAFNNLKAAQDFFLD